MRSVASAQTILVTAGGRRSKKTKTKKEEEVFGWTEWVSGFRYSIGFLASPSSKGGHYPLHIVGRRRN